VTMAGRAAIVLAVVALAAGAAHANPSLVPPDVGRPLHAASVELLPVGCSGVVAEDAQLVLTARHCASDVGARLRVRFRSGAERPATVVATDTVSDQTVLLLDDPGPAPPLEVATRVPIPGSVLYFEGNPARPRPQELRLDRIGACPSLPDLPNALFTSLKGTPGDSGAPVVDRAGRIVGLVHGGARCEIVTPADHLSRLLDRVFERGPMHVARQVRVGPQV